jgi:hypothetical protein
MFNFSEGAGGVKEGLCREGGRSQSACGASVARPPALVVLVSDCAYQRLTHLVDQVQNLIAVIDYLYRLRAQAFYIGNGRADSLNYFSVFLCH